MVSVIEPVEIGTTDGLKCEPGTIFFISPDTEDEFKSLGLVDDGSYIFWIVNRSDEGRSSSFWVGKDVVCLGVFCDYVMHNYPDHFEWLLFNPEWLQ